jgi:signal transduction histidine kinase
MEQSQKLSLAGQIAAGVAHEIKNPLASIKGAADILGDDDTSQEERDEFKGILQREVQRIDGTVTDFLAFARPRETRRAKMDLSESVRRTARQVEGQAASSGVRVEVDAAEGATIEGDTEKIQQLTLNLVLNAVQASRPGDSVRVRALADGKTVRLLVEDNGPGIAPGDVDHIFEPFYTSRPTGSGLGLAVARAIVDAHDGTIAVRSTPGNGSTFEVRLPLAGGDGA